MAKSADSDERAPSDAMVERDFDKVMADNRANDIMLHKPTQNDSTDQEKNKGDKNADSFEEFTSNTTLHGVRFIGDQSSYIPRRIIWLGVVLLSATFFTIQVVDRVQYYLQSPITVNFKVNYNKSLTFPAITICNQNLFRVTAAYEKKLDHIIEEMFGDTDGNNTMTEADYNMMLDVLYTDLAHNKEDLIIKCYWGNSECSSENFTTTLTSHGVCFTFNKVDSLDKALTVEASGVDHGLRLVLNTETYEKMNGPHHTDGIKLIATDQSEIPSVEEIGLAISAGAHAFVGLGVVSLNNLEPPYGRCGTLDLRSTDRYTPDSCLLECQTKYVVGICNCRHFYMPNLNDNTRTCNVRDYFGCLQKTIRRFNERKDELCECPTSCVYNIYETSVSYAKKSSWKSVFDGNSSGLSRKQDINDTFFAANEIKSRINTGSGIRDLRTSIEETLSHLDGLASMFNFLSQNTLFDQKTLFYLHNETIHAAARRDSLYDFQLYMIEKNFIGGRDAKEERSFGVLCQSYFEFLTDIFHKTSFLLNQNEGPNAEMTNMLLDGLLTNRINIALSTKFAYTQLIKAYENGEPLLDHSYKSFNNSVHLVAIPKELLKDSLFNTDTANESVLRMEDIDKILMELFNMDTLIDIIFENKSHNLDSQNITSVGKELSDACEAYLDKKSIFYSEVIEKPARILNERKTNLKSLKTNYGIAYESVYNHMVNIQHATTADPIPPLNEILRSAMRYINGDHEGNVTKFDISYNLSSPDISLKIRNLEMMLADIKTRLIGIVELLPNLENRLYEIWEHMLKFDGDNGPYDSLMDDWSLNGPYSDRGRSISRLFGPMSSQYYRGTTMIESVDHKTIVNIKEVMSQSESYVQSHKMDDNFYKDNFLEVDIYFKELRSEQIDQQKAYDEFALLCDIGGSMGLFIGGSAITFFEIVDFIIVCCVHRFCRRKL